jgi:hypothetical protein
MVRYSNEYIFSTVALAPELRMVNVQNMTDQDRFNQLLNKTMTELASQASNFPTGANKKFETKEVYMDFTQIRELYNLVQCTPDLSSADCNNCLQAAINNLLIYSSGKQGGRVFFPSCIVRYEWYPFYNIESTKPTPAPGVAPPPPGSIAGSKGEVDHSFYCFMKQI